MAKSEIDDIFAAKGKAKADIPVASSSSAAPEKKKKTKKKTKDAAEPDEPSSEVKASSKRRLPETIVDTSAKLEAPPSKRAKVDKTATPSATASKKKANKGNGKDDQAAFRDSRGTGPRRRTEEGFAIYKEDELGISHKGGDTSLCPFDCECCF